LPFQRGKGKSERKRDREREREKKGKRRWQREILPGIRSVWACLT